MKFHRGIIIVSPHGTYIKNKKKKIIVKSKCFNSIIGKTLLLIENKKALGYIKLVKIFEINENQFVALRSKHLITDAERKKWWPSKIKFYAYIIKIIKMFDTPKNINYSGGPQVFVKPESIF